MLCVQKVLRCQDEYGNRGITVAVEEMDLDDLSGSTGLNGISAMMLHLDIRVRQTTAWFMLQRIQEGLIPGKVLFDDPVEVVEAHLGAWNIISRI